MAQLSTATTNFDKSVTDLIVRELVDSLRAGTPWLPKGSVRNARLVPGTNGTARFFSIADLGAETGGNSYNLGEGTPPTPVALALDYVDFATVQKGQLVKITDLAMDESIHNLARNAAEKVKRQALIEFDDVARALYAAQAAEIVSTTATITAADIAHGVGLLRQRNVLPLDNGLYVAITDPSVASDISLLADYINVQNYANPTALTSGVVGIYRGVAIVVSSRNIAPFGAGTGAVTGVVATDLLTSTAHGLIAGQAVQFAGLTGTFAGLVNGTTYYVISSGLTTNDFRVSATKGGATVDITGTSITGGTFTPQNHRVQLVGKDALAFADLTSLQVHFTAPGGRGDELHQSALVGWKARVGGKLIAMDETDAGLTNVPRTVGIDADVSYAL